MLVEQTNVICYMDLMSPEFFTIGLSHTIPPHLDSHKITHSKPLYGVTAKGEYLFQNFTHKFFQASFISLLSTDKHEITLLKQSPSFFITVQLENTLECKFFNLPKTEYLEGAINLFFGSNFFSEISLNKSQESKTLLFFVPPEIAKESSEYFPPIKAFYNEQTNKDGTNRLLTNNGIYSFKLLDLINCFQRNEEKTINTYIELVHACFELLSKKSLRKQKHIDVETTKKIYALKKFLLEHATEKLHRSNLCEMFDLSIHHFEKTFSNIYGVSPFSFLRFCAMSKVKELIQTTDLPLKEIAVMFGYTYTSLLRAYKAVFKVHPKSHRQKKIEREHPPYY